MQSYDNISYPRIKEEVDNLVQQQLQNQKAKLDGEISKS